MPSPSSSRHTPPPSPWSLTPPSDPPARHGLAAVKATLERKYIVVKEAKKPTTSLTLEAALDKSLTIPESLKVTVNAADDRGLMYALLDIAARIDWSPSAADPFAEVHDLAESPDIKERAISIDTMSRPYFESRLFDEKYWTAYLDNLAANRFNSLMLIFGYENGGYMAPAYPYLFDVDGFSGCFGFSAHIVGDSEAPAGSVWLLMMAAIRAAGSRSSTEWRALPDSRGTRETASFLLAARKKP